MHWQDFAMTWRNDIALFQKEEGLVYLDSSATALKPQQMIDSVVEYYSEYPSNVHRGSYNISIRASEEYTNARNILKRFFNTGDDYEIIFCAGMTDGSNMLSHAMREVLRPNDNVIITEIEHHSSMLPWRRVCRLTGADCKVLPIDKNGELELKKLDEWAKEAKIISITGMSNVTAYCPPLEEIQNRLTSSSGNQRCKMIVDATQLAVHKKIDLSKDPYDAILCSAHKFGGPTGIGAMCIKKDWLEELNANDIAFSSGGGTVDSVTLDEIVYSEGALRHEPGTPHVAGAIGFGRILEYFEEKGWEQIYNCEKELRKILLEQVKRLKGVKIIGDEHLSASPIISFVSENIHPQDIAFAMEQKNICIRSGKLCAEPLLIKLTQHQTYSQVARVSAFCYNNKKDILCFGDALESFGDLFH